MSPQGQGDLKWGRSLKRGDSEGKRTRTQRGKGTRKGGNGVAGFLGGESDQQPRPDGDNRAQIARVGRGRSYANGDPPD